MSVIIKWIIPNVGKTCKQVYIVLVRLSDYNNSKEMNASAYVK